jgi:formamidopyrimidine-DNA glycosylase
MPELPEVESVRRTLEPFLLNVEITAVAAHRDDFITPPSAPLKHLVAHRFTRTLRHGKKLFLIADDSQTLLIHLGMSGRIDCVPANAPLEKHTHVVLTLNTGIQVRFRDPRRFGGLWYYPTLEQALAHETTSLGKDALDLTPHDLARWRRTRGRAKQRLLSQKDVAGLGNIYVDEALWEARIHPRQLVSRIPADRLAVLVNAIVAVLRKSIVSGGTTLRDYRNVSDQPGQFARELQAYGRAGQPCKRCGTILRGAQIATRTTVFCPHCQKCR